MKITKFVAAAAIGLMSAVSAQANTLTFQGVTFNTWAVDADTMGLSILNANNATGNWAGVNFLKSFEIKEIGNVASASIVSGPGSFAANVDHGVAANGVGCTSGNTQGACFSASPALALTNSMTWTIDFVAANGATLNFDLPHLKVQFLTRMNDIDKTGDLLSRTIVTAVPEPGTYAMMLAGLGLMGTIARRRKAGSQS